MTLASDLNSRKSCLWGHLSHFDTFLDLIYKKRDSTLGMGGLGRI